MWADAFLGRLPENRCINIGILPELHMKSRTPAGDCKWSLAGVFVVSLLF